MQDIVSNGWLMQPRLQGERMQLPDKERAQPVAWAPAGANAARNKSMVWLQTEFATPPGSSALV